MPAEKEHIDLPKIDLLLRRLRESNFVAATVVPAEERLRESNFVAATVVPAEEDGFYQLQIGERQEVRDQLLWCSNSIEKDP